MKRLKATLLQLCLRKDEERKPKPKAAMRVKSLMTEREGGMVKKEGRMRDGQNGHWKGHLRAFTGTWSDCLSSLGLNFLI